MARPSLRFALAIALSLALSACGGGGGPPADMQMPPTPVNVAQVLNKPVTAWDEFSGRIEAVERVELRPRVSGYLESVHFEEGRQVQAGQLLFRIDAREYQAALAAAKADTQRASTRLEVARQNLSRIETLAQAKAASQEELEQARGETRQAEADLGAAQARVAQAQLNVDFCEIRAPFTGLISQALIRPGNWLAAGQSLLTTLVSVDPVHVAFDGDERMYLHYQSLARAGERPSSRDSANPVRIGLANEEGFPHLGKMVFVDNALDPATGSIRAKAELPNPDGRFTPGLFARVQLLGETAEEAMLIHDQAVLTDQDRKYVYVVGPNNTALRKDVVLGASIEGLRVVESGLEASDRVVVNGMRKIFFPGAPLQPIEVPMTEPNKLVEAAVEAPADSAGTAPQG